MIAVLTDHVLEILGCAGARWLWGVLRPHVLLYLRAVLGEPDPQAEADAQLRRQLSRKRPRGS